MLALDANQVPVGACGGSICCRTRSCRVAAGSDTLAQAARREAAASMPARCSDPARGEDALALRSAYETTHCSCPWTLRSISAEAACRRSHAISARLPA